MQTYIDMLVESGIPYIYADEIVTEYWNNEDLNGLLKYIDEIRKGVTVLDMEVKDV